MRRFKIMWIIAIIVISINCFVYADDEIEETSITQEEINEILETAVEADETPIINSRNAVIYDRTSRKNLIWKERKYKM